MRRVVVDPIVCDPNNDRLIALAREAVVDVIVSGDTDLLVFERIEVPILGASSRVDELEGRRGACGAYLGAATACCQELEVGVRARDLEPDRDAAVFQEERALRPRFGLYPLVSVGVVPRGCPK